MPNRARAAANDVCGVSTAAGTVALAIATLLFRYRLLHYGSYGDFRRGILLDLRDVKLGYVLIALILGLGASSAFVALELFRDSRRVRTR